MSLLRSGIWIQSWPSCWRGARGAPVQLVVGQSLCVALVRWYLWGLDEGGVRIQSITRALGRKS